MQHSDIRPKDDMQIWNLVRNAFSVGICGRKRPGFRLTDHMRIWNFFRRSLCKHLWTQHPGIKPKDDMRIWNLVRNAVSVRICGRNILASDLRIICGYGM